MCPLPSQGNMSRFDAATLLRVLFSVLIFFNFTFLIASNHSSLSLHAVD